jgi:hypothetical protein
MSKVQTDVPGLPIKGMKLTPFGWPLMADAYLGLVYFLVGKPEWRDQFKADTGMDIERVLCGRGIEAMVDKATGYDQAVVARFADWVTEFHWGDEADAEEIMAMDINET